MRSLLKFWRHYRRTSGARHEWIAAGICLAIGLLLMPVLIWLVGSSRLGPYANGGLFALWRDYVVALAHGSLAFWLVALGPYVALWLLRGARLWLRR
ncbi:MAG TPA: hypothetical protein VMT49_10360 [Steroidobacteraceae bacterium]|nr:hypothetical protein [Steroidobacteraceae bacterium]